MHVFRPLNAFEQLIQHGVIGMVHRGKSISFAFTTLFVFGLLSYDTAAAPLDLTKISSWYCSVLKQPFDARAAMKSFPFEVLPVPTEVRKASDTRVNVSITAEGDEWVVEYDYAFPSDAVDDVYGISLSVSPADRLKDFEQIAMKWLRSFGEPEKEEVVNIFYVGAGPERAIGGRPFRFEVWSDYKLSASWFYPRHIKYAAELCSKVQ